MPYNMNVCVIYKICGCFQSDKWFTVDDFDYAQTKNLFSNYVNFNFIKTKIRKGNERKYYN